MIGLSVRISVCLFVCLFVSGTKVNNLSKLDQNMSSTYNVWIRNRNVIHSVYLMFGSDLRSAQKICVLFVLQRGFCLLRHFPKSIITAVSVSRSYGRIWYDRRSVLPITFLLDIGNWCERLATQAHGVCDL